MKQLLRRLPALALLVAPLASHAAAGLSDAAGDFLPTFGGTSAMTDLDVLFATVVYDLNTDVFTLSATLAGPVGLSTNALYVWGVNRGAGTAGFAANGLPGVLFDRTVLLRPDGTGSVGATALPAGSVLISGNTITGTVSGALLPVNGFTKQNYTYNLWPRNTTFAGFAAISDFAPDNSNFTATVVPEPASWALMAGGLAGLLAWRRRR